MRIAQIVLAGASQYERKCQRIDATALSSEHQTVLVTAPDATPSIADAAHVYASEPLLSSSLVRLSLPYLASAPLAATRWSLRRAPAPRYVVSPLAEDEPRGGTTHLPEAVEEAYFSSPPATVRPRAESGARIGSFARTGVRNMVEQTLSRIHRFRDDVEWLSFEAPPTPQEIAELDAWIDPAIEEKDFDGFVAEALVAGLPVVASRTAINIRRLEKGRTGMLVPPRDPNEMTHAILTMLFKPEVAESRQQAARQTIGRFRPRQRARVLTRLYETLIS